MTVPMFERRHLSGVELRTEGRRLSGTVLEYADVSPSHRERFEPGALRVAEAVSLNLMHDPLQSVAWHPGGGLQLEHDESALRMVAEVPPIPAGDVALAMVRDGQARGLSIEFQAELERRESGVRVIEAATLTGVGLVSDPSYLRSTVEARRKGDRGERLASYRFRVPADRNLACRCGPRDCNDALIKSGALDDYLDPEAQQGLLAVFGDFGRPLASGRRQTLRFWSDAQGGLYGAVDVPNTTLGRELVEAIETVDMIARPIVDVGSSAVAVEGTTAVYDRVAMRGVGIAATDQTTGWPLLEAITKAALEAADELPAAAPAARRAKLWL